MRFISSSFRSCLNYVKKSIICSDMFGAEVKLWFEGQSSFKTVIGGLSTVIIKLTSFAIMIWMLVNIIQRNNSTKNISKLITDLSTDTTKHYIGKSTFAYAIKLQGPNPNLIFDSSYFTFEFNQVEYIRANTTKGKFAILITMNIN